jgi:hypothetical protein
VPNSNVCNGTGTTLTLSAAQGTIAWQKATVTNGVLGTFTSITGGNGMTLSTGNLTNTTAYRVLVSSGACSVSSTQPLILTVSPVPLIKSIVGAGAICNGNAKTLYLAAGSIGSIQWQSSSTSATATDFTNINGATSSVSYTDSPTNTKWYRAVASSGSCTPSISAAVAITVNQPTSVGTLSTLNSSICTGSVSTINLSSASGTITWQKAAVSNGLIGTYSNVSGNNGFSLNTGNLTTSTAYKVIVSSGVCSTSATQPIIISVSPAAKVTAINGSNTITSPACVGDTQTLSLAAGYAGTVEWLSSNTLTGTYTVIPGATSSTYNYVPTVTSVKYFKVRMTSSPCSLTQTSAVGVPVYAKICPNSTVQTTKAIDEDVTVEAVFNVNTYPNPFNSFFKLDLETSNSELVNYSLYDMTGRSIEMNLTQPSQIKTLEIGKNIPSGIYNLNISQGTEMKTLRVIKM